jgi:hypothetical protein
VITNTAVYLDDGVPQVQEEVFIFYYPDDPRTPANEQRINAQIATGLVATATDIDADPAAAGIQNIFDPGDDLRIGFTAASGGLNAGASLVTGRLRIGRTRLCP